MLLQADNIVTGDGKTVLENGAVVIADGKIVYVGAFHAARAAYPNEAVVSYPGATLMPGMIDLHNHIGYFAGQQNRDDLTHYGAMRPLFAAKRMRQTLNAGVTTIRDLASADSIGVALIKAGQAGYLDVPRIFTCNKGICITGGHGFDLYGACVEADGEQEVRKAVRTNLREGANCIKILTSEGYRGEEMSQAEICAAADEAHRFGVRIAAHAGYGASIQMCIDAGCDTIEHGTHLRYAQCEQMRRNDQTWVPTISVFQYSYEQITQAGLHDPLLQRNLAYLKDSCACYARNFKTLYDSGVRVACGTDTDCCDHPEAAPVATECEWMVRYGLTPLQAIECATKNGAEALGIGETVGLLKAGYAADIIAVQGKPFAEISALHNVSAVYTAGRKII